MKKDEAAPPLVFVYVGNPPPKYARDSMIFASGGHNGRIVLLTNVDHEIPEDRRYDVQRINDWYDPSPFAQFRNHASLDAAFMGGFWFHVVERFFVLHQFMVREQISSLFHAELDVIVVDLEGVSEACDAHATGIYAVMDDKSRALASLFYVNSIEKFAHFIDFASKDLSMRNEMEMIGSYLQQHPERGHAFPSNSFFEPGSPQLSPSQLPDDIGLFDANAFGQWLFGLDPKIVKYESRNHFRNEMVRFDIENLRFHAPLFGRHFVVSQNPSVSRRLRTLHVHSKILGRLRFRLILKFYLSLNNLRRASVVTHRSGWWASKILDFIFSKRIWFILGRIAGGQRNLLTRTILWLAKRGAVPMPNRQREMLSARLPWAPLGSRRDMGSQLWVIVETENLDAVKAAIAEIESMGLLPQTSVVTIGRKREIQDFVRSVGNTCIELSREEPITQLAVNLFRSNEDSIVLVKPGGIRNLTRSVFDSAGRQIVVFSRRKGDRAALHLANSAQFSGLRQELAFSRDFIPIRPSLLREIFSHNEDLIREWAFSAVTATSKPSLGQLYGSWLWTHHQDSVRLAREL